MQILYTSLLITSAAIFSVISMVFFEPFIKGIISKVMYIRAFTFFTAITVMGVIFSSVIGF